MTNHDFSDLTPPEKLVCEWASYLSSKGVLAAARWGAQQAAERLKGQWPTPITDRPPTKADGNSRGWVQYVRDDGAWDFRRWEDVAADGDEWQHCPNWQPPALPTLKEQALVELARLEKNFHVDPVLRRALEADS